MRRNSTRPRRFIYSMAYCNKKAKDKTYEHRKESMVLEFATTPKDAHFSGDFQTNNGILPRCCMLHSTCLNISDDATRYSRPRQSHVCACTPYVCTRQSHISPLLFVIHSSQSWLHECVSDSSAIFAGGVPRKFCYSASRLSTTAFIGKSFLK